LTKLKYWYVHRYNIISVSFNGFNPGMQTVILGEQFRSRSAGTSLPCSLKFKIIGLLLTRGRPV
jgi:hypothetical protein